VAAPRYDIVIVGAGPAGAAAGITAARRGARVCVLDRARFPRPKTCGDAVSNRAVSLADALTGKTDVLRSVPHAVVLGASAILPDGSRIDRDFGADPGVIVPRYDLDALLRGELEAAGAEVLEGVRVRGLETDRGRVVGAVGDRGAWSAPVVIAADGPGSVAWTALGRPYRRGIHLAVAITGYYEGIDFSGGQGVTEHYFERGLRCGYGWIFPEVGGRANVGVYQRQDRFVADGRSLTARLEAFVRAHPGRFHSARLVGKTRTWALPLAVALRPPGGPGLLLAGDAAYSIDPLSGEGIWQALHSGRSAGQIATDALSGGGLSATWVRRYQRRWARDLGVASLLRLAVQEGMDAVVERGAYRWGPLRRILSRGYRSESFEVSKRLAP
jgi:menaquinone-9 beta-reductase